MPPGSTQELLPAAPRQIEFETTVLKKYLIPFENNLGISNRGRNKVKLVLFFSEYLAILKRVLREVAWFLSVPPSSFLQEGKMLVKVEINNLFHATSS